METPSLTSPPSWDRENIRALRTHMGLTQQELAEHLGTRQQTISEWEKGLYRPRGASSTLLSIVAERARFRYEPEGHNREGHGASRRGQEPPARHVR